MNYRNVNDEKEIEKRGTRGTLVSFIISVILTIMFLWLLSSCSTHRCATYGYKRVYVNGKKYYFDPHKPAPTIKRK